MMSETKHTPGPWMAAAKDLAGHVQSWRVYSPDGQEVARVHRWNGLGDEANARLIAATPDLLAALSILVRTCFDAHRHGYGATEQEAIHWAIVDAQAAIRKAEGR